MNSETLQMIGIVLAIISIVFWISWSSESAGDYKNEIIADLAKNNCELVDIRLAGFMKTGPIFPIQLTIKPSWWIFLNQEQTKFRIVSYKNRQRETKESWIKIEARRKAVTSIQWRPEL